MALNHKNDDQTLLSVIEETRSPIKDDESTNESETTSDSSAIELSDSLKEEKNDLSFQKESQQTSNEQKKTKTFSQLPNKVNYENDLDTITKSSSSSVIDDSESFFDQFQKAHQKLINSIRKWVL